MFSIDLSPTYFWSVRFSVPKADGSGHDRCEFEGEFSRKTVDEISALGTDALDNRVSDADLSRRLLVGWRGVTDVQGNPVAFSDPALGKLLQIPGAGTAVVTAFYDSMSDKAASPNAATKN